MQTFTLCRFSVPLEAFYPHSVPGPLWKCSCSYVVYDSKLIRADALFFEGHKILLTVVNLGLPHLPPNCQETE